MLTTASWDDISPETRQRAIMIDGILDRINPTVVLGDDWPRDWKYPFDPTKSKTTSQLAVYTAKATVAAAKQRRKELGHVLPDLTQSVGNRSDLQKKLDRRILELKEDRRKMQSEKDKEIAVQIREARLLEFKRRQMEGVLGDGTAELGRITTTVRPAEVAHAIEKNPKGEKTRRLQTQLRKGDNKKVRLEKATGDERDDLEKDFEMEAAVARARGEKVYDDIAKLRKGNRQKERKKVRGIAKWKDRLDLQEQYQGLRTQKRQENLQKRIDRKKGKRLQRSGFEGKHGDFLNK